MRHRRADVVARALTVLDDYGLADLTMRRLATELDVQPGALYHHFPSKQVLLAAVADEILARGARSLPEGSWDQRARAACHRLRDACLAYRDGAEVVATARAFRVGAQAPYDDLVDVLRDGIPPELAGVAARTLIHYVLGHALDEQTHRQATTAGAIEAEVLTADHSADFGTGLDLVLSGLRVRVSG